MITQCKVPHKIVVCGGVDCDLISSRLLFHVAVVFAFLLVVPKKFSIKSDSVYPTTLEMELHLATDVLVHQLLSNFSLRILSPPETDHYVTVGVYFCVRQNLNKRIEKEFSASYENQPNIQPNTQLVFNGTYGLCALMNIQLVFPWFGKKSTQTRTVCVCVGVCSSVLWSIWQ